MYPVLICTEQSFLNLPYTAEHLNRGRSIIIDASLSIPARYESSRQLFFQVPFNLKEVTENTDYLDKVFSLGEVSVTETVASVPKAPVREAVRAAIQNAFFSQNLPYVHLWYYPGDYQSMFSFRFDMDEYHPEHHRNFLKLLEAARGSVSCFACMRTYELQPQALFEVVRTGVELASHGYIHHVYHNYRQNNLNLARAEELLEPAAGRISGFSAPHGKWHPTLQRVLENRGYTYSSEFSLDYDNFPFYTFSDNDFSPVLQIPTHPVCEGVFLQRYDYDIELFSKYYGHVIEEHIRRCEPVLIFGHPTNRLGKYPEIFHFIFNAVSARNDVWKTEFREIASWWQRRHALQLEASFSEGSIRFDALPQEVSVHAVYPDGRSLRMRSDKTPAVTQTITAKSTPDSIAVSPAKYGSVKKFRLFLKKSLDWETKTPVEMLEIADTSSLVKKIMRITRGRAKQETQNAY